MASTRPMEILLRSKESICWSLCAGRWMICARPAHGLRLPQCMLTGRARYSEWGLSSLPTLLTGRFAAGQSGSPRMARCGSAQAAARHSKSTRESSILIGLPLAASGSRYAASSKLAAAHILERCCSLSAPALRPTRPAFVLQLLEYTADSRMIGLLRRRGYHYLYWPFLSEFLQYPTSRYETLL